ncbi:hypothetical protein ACIBG0_40725 [Nocardia sp. NPDC050630]|uniref:hypothetical protein n=1 Tax=Nocardia sp. NPDC050630 TaxID=3364321 RepID=UPI00379EFE2E
MAKIPGSAGLVLVEGVRHLDEPAAVFEGMLAGWAKQQAARMLGQTTIDPRIQLVRRFVEFAGSYPWAWTAGDVEEFTVSLTSEAGGWLAVSTIRGYHLTLRMFCDYLTDTCYEWVRQCRDRFGQVPVQVCHEWNSVAHLTDYEGRPGRRPLSYGELQQLFDYLRRPGGTDRSIGPQGNAGSAAGRADDQNGICPRPTPE